MKKLKKLLKRWIARRFPCEYCTRPIDECHYRQGSDGFNVGAPEGYYGRWIVNHDHRETGRPYDIFRRVWVQIDDREVKVPGNWNEHWLSIGQTQNRWVRVALHQTPYYFQLDGIILKAKELAYKRYVAAGIVEPPWDIVPQLKLDDELSSPMVYPPNLK